MGEVIEGAGPLVLWGAGIVAVLAYALLERLVLRRAGRRVERQPTRCWNCRAVIYPLDRDLEDCTVKLTPAGYKLVCQRCARRFG